MTAPAKVPPRASLVQKIAAKYNVDADKMLTTLKATVFKGQKAKDGGPPREATNEELMSLLIVADQYGLNPFTREIYAFPDDKRGGIVPVVSVDGWLRIINEKPQLRALEITYGDFRPIEGETEAERKECRESMDPYVEVTIVRSDRDKPISVREYMHECYRDTGPWQSHPRRMLRHKAIIQAGRVAFGFGGIFDPDEAERIRDAAIEIPPSARKPETAAPKAKESAALPLIGKDELLAALDATGVSEAAVCEKFAIANLDELSAEGLKLAKRWAETVNAPPIA